MPPDSTLRKSIVAHGAVFYIGQTIVLFLIFLGYGMELARLGIFLSLSFFFHVLLTGFLAARSADFKIEGSPEPLRRVNLSNALTFLRLSSLPTVLFIILQSIRYPLLPVALPVLSVVFLTDFLDGIIARRRKEITFVGRYLDSASDYLMIIAVSILFYYFRLVPLWFFLLLMARLLLVALGMAWLALMQGRANPVATFLGKASIFATMVLYVLEVAEFFKVPWIGDPAVVRIIELIAAGIIVASIVDKTFFLRAMLLGAGRCRRDGKDAPEGKVSSKRVVSRPLHRSGS